jgi:hypothetical protein
MQTRTPRRRRKKSFTPLMELGAGSSCTQSTLFMLCGSQFLLAVLECS